MRNFRLSLVAAFVLLFMGLGIAASVDVYQFRDTTKRGAPVAWRITSGTGSLLPGNNATQIIGSASSQVGNGTFSNFTATNLTSTRFVVPSTTVTANTTLTVANTSRVRIGSLSGNITLTIPSAVTAGADFEMDIQDIGGSLDSTHTVTINSTSGNLNGSSTLALATAYGGKRLFSNGTNWFAR